MDIESSVKLWKG